MEKSQNIMKLIAAIWSLTIRSFLKSYYNFFASLTLTTQEILFEYRLITCLLRPFPVFSLFSFNSFTPFVFSICFIDSYVDSFISSFMCLLFLARSTFSLLITWFKHFHSPCCSTSFFGVSTISSKKSSFNIFPDMSFITCRNCHHMLNNMTYKDNINAKNNTFVIIF